jgi:hypothetical protein
MRFCLLIHPGQKPSGAYELLFVSNSAKVFLGDSARGNKWEAGRPLYDRFGSIPSRYAHENAQVNYPSPDRFF